MRFLFLLALLLPALGYADVPKLTDATGKPFFGLKTDLYNAKKASRAPVYSGYLHAEALYPKHLDLRDTGKLSPIVDQGNCGSCVYNAGQSTIFDNYALAGYPLPGLLSRQFQMDCGKGWSCDGNLADYFLQGVQKTGGSPLESVYPYRAQDQNCKGTTATLYGQVADFRTLDGSAKSAIAAMNRNEKTGAKQTLMITVAAQGRFMSPGSGVLTSCEHGQVNHQISLVGYDCETAVDAAGNCVFDARGNLPPGVGYWIYRNSWSTGYGDRGFGKIKMTDSSGRKCFEINDEVTEVTPKVEPKPPVPAPSCSLKAAKNDVSVNEKVEVAVTAKDAEKASFGGTAIALANGVGKFEVSYGTPGFQTVRVDVTGPGGVALCETQLTVLPEVPSEP